MSRIWYRSLAGLSVGGSEPGGRQKLDQGYKIGDKVLAKSFV
jgi:hypothetical protein